MYDNLLTFAIAMAFLFLVGLVLCTWYYEDRINHLEDYLDEERDLLCTERKEHERTLADLRITDAALSATKVEHTSYVEQLTRELYQSRLEFTRLRNDLAPQNLSLVHPDS